MLPVVAINLLKLYLFDVLLRLLITEHTNTDTEHGTRNLVTGSPAWAAAPTMNHVQRRLTELELPESHMREALQFTLHTIVFARKPHTLTPVDVHCVHFPMSYASCGDADVQANINESVERAMATLVEAGPDLHRGFITLSFYRRVSKGVLWTSQEKVIWEEWIIPFLVNSAPQPAAASRIPASERSRLQQAADVASSDHFEQWMFRVFFLINESVDHIPSQSEGSHEFQISCIQRMDQRESGRARAFSAPLPMPIS